MVMIRVLLKIISIAMFKKLEILLWLQLNKILFRELKKMEIFKILCLEVSVILWIHNQKEIFMEKRLCRLLLMWIVSSLFQNLENSMPDFKNKLVNYSNLSMTQMLQEMNSIDKKLSLKLKLIFWKMMIFLDCNEWNIYSIKKSNIFGFILLKF